MRVTRALANAVSCVLLGATASIVAAPAAQAWFLPDTCVVESRDRWVAPAPTQWRDPAGATAAESPVGRTFTADDGTTYNYGATAREWFGGTSGLGLTSSNFVSQQGYDANKSIQSACESGLLSGTASKLISWFWTPAMSLNDLSANVLEASQVASIIPWFADTIIVPLQQGNDTDGDGKGDGAGLNDAYYGGIVIVFAIAIGYGVFAAAKGRFKATGKNLVWTIGMVGISGALLSNPLILPTAGQWAASNIGTAFSSVASTAVRAAGDDANTAWCTLDDTVNYPANLTTGGGTTPVPSKAVRQIACDFWDATAVSSWRLGQFGTRGAVVTANAAGWSKATQDPSIAVNIPGVLVQPEPGDIAALHLSTQTLNPAEQRWLEAYLAANPGVSADTVIATKLAGGAGVEGTLNEDIPEAAYPASEIYSAGVGVGAQNLGHQQRFESLVDRVSDLPGGTYASWSGVSDSAPAQRFLALSGLVTNSMTATLSVGIFSVMTLYYQFLFGLMLTFLPLAMLGMALPFRSGWQIAKDYFSKLVENIILVCAAMVFSIGAVFTSVVVPNLFLGDSLGGEAAAHLMRPLIAGIGLVALLIAWNRVRKGFRSKIPQVMRANDRTIWDVGSVVGEKMGSAAKTAAVIGGVVAVGAATGGAAGAALASKGVARQAATSAVYGGGPVASTRRGATAHLKSTFADSIPGDDTSLKRMVEERSERKAQRRAARVGADFETTEQREARVEQEKEEAAIDREARVRAKAWGQQIAQAPQVHTNGAPVEVVEPVTETVAPVSPLIVPPRSSAPTSTPHRYVQGSAGSGFDVVDRRAATVAPPAKRRDVNSESEGPVSADTRSLEKDEAETRAQPKQIVVPGPRRHGGEDKN